MRNQRDISDKVTGGASWTFTNWEVDVTVDCDTATQTIVNNALGSLALQLSEMGIIPPSTNTA